VAFKGRGATQEGERLLRGRGATQVGEGERLLQGKRGHAEGERLIKKGKAVILEWREMHFFIILLFCLKNYE
jgi:hypothetical protein